MNIYNPMSLDVNTDEPTFTNEDGVKWWLVHVGSSLNKKRNDITDGAVYRILRPDGYETYLVVVGDSVVKDTGNLEQAFYQVDVNYLARTKL